MVEPITLSACMHRFCITCINNNFSRESKKSCPMCRIEYPGLLNKQFKVKHIDTQYCRFLKQVFPDEYQLRYKELFGQGFLLEFQEEIQLEFGNMREKPPKNAKSQTRR